jgi:putative transposon-encoded protein
MKGRIGQKRQLTLRVPKIAHILQGNVVSTGNSAKVGCPAKYQGRKAYVLILPEGADYD